MILILLKTLIFIFTLIHECALYEIEVKFDYKKDGALKCTNESSVNVTFYFKNDQGNLTEIKIDSSKYVLNKNTNTLIIKELRKADMQKLYYCETSSGETVDFIPQVSPYLYQPDLFTLSSNEDQTAEIDCFLLVGSENNQSVTWRWMFNNQTLASSRYTIISSRTESKLKISNVELTDKGDYFCIAENEFGSHKRNVELRVKSRLAPLWPFLGFLGEAFFITLIISTYEQAKHENESWNNQDDDFFTLKEDDENKKQNGKKEK